MKGEHGAFTEGEANKTKFSDLKVNVTTPTYA
jgi:rubredoxin